MSDKKPWTTEQRRKFERMFHGKEKFGGEFDLMTAPPRVLAALSRRYMACGHREVYRMQLAEVVAATVSRGLEEVLPS